MERKEEMKLPTTSVRSSPAVNCNICAAIRKGYKSKPYSLPWYPHDAGSSNVDDRLLQTTAVIRLINASKVTLDLRCAIVMILS